MKARIVIISYLVLGFSFFLVGLIRQDSETGRMMRIELQWCQVQAGTAKHLLGDSSDQIDYIETCWVMSIRDFLRTYGLKAELSVTPIQTIQCINDEFIMDALGKEVDARQNNCKG